MLKEHKRSILSYLFLTVSLFSSIITYSCSSTREKDSEKVMTWAIFKISYDPNTNMAEGGICGSAFFFKEQFFISAYHCFNDSVFTPNKNFPKVKVFLVNNRGDIIDDIRIKKLVPEYDLAIGEVIQHDKNVIAYSLANDFNVGDSVYNIGFPTESLINYRIKIEKNNLFVENIILKEFRQNGEVEDILRITVNSNDVKLDNKLMIKLTYTSKLGFSGGPCLLKSSGKVIGMMSMLIPFEIDPKKPAMAVRISDILQFLETK
ncbi:MAG: serine protease [Porphyromonadaceae bacterium]|nr:MAG: serine protease [Porphyromonadaceae bacterium]